MQILGVTKRFSYPFASIKAKTAKAVLFELHNGQTIWLPNTWITNLKFNKKKGGGTMYVTSYGHYKLVNLIENRD